MYDRWQADEFAGGIPLRILQPALFFQWRKAFKAVNLPINYAVGQIKIWRNVFLMF